MERLYDRFRNTLGVVLGLATGLFILNPVALKAIGMLPVLSILTPSQNQEVSGYVTFYAVADSEGIASLQFQIDGQNVGSEIVAGSCRAAWNSDEAADGLHTLQAIARSEDGSAITSQPVTVRVNNFVPPPPTPTPPPTTTPTPTPPPTTTPPPGTAPSTDAVLILSPGANTQIAGTVPVTVAIPAQTSQVWIQLLDVWGTTINSWGGSVTASAAAATVQVNVALGGLATANFSLRAMAVVKGQQLVSAPVPVRVDNTPSPGPTPPGPTRPSTRDQIALRPKARPVAGNPENPGGGSGGTSSAVPAARAGARNASNSADRPLGSTTSSKTQASTAASRTQPPTGASNPQKSTIPKASSLPSGTIIFLGLGPCAGTDPYAKHPTLRGECVSGTWFPRPRKTEQKREN